MIASRISFWSQLEADNSVGLNPISWLNLKCVHPDETKAGTVTTLESVVGLERSVQYDGYVSVYMTRIPHSAWASILFPISSSVVSAGLDLCSSYLDFHLAFPFSDAYSHLDLYLPQIWWKIMIDGKRYKISLCKHS